MPLDSPVGNPLVRMGILGRLPGELHPSGTVRHHRQRVWWRRGAPGHALSPLCTRTHTERDRTTIKSTHFGVELANYSPSPVRCWSVVFSSSIDAGSDVPNLPRVTTVMRYKAFASKFVRSILVSLVVNS